MASAILTSRNAPRSSDYMSEYTNSNVNFMGLQSIPNPNPNSSHFIVGNSSRDVLWKPNQRLPSSAPLRPAFVAGSTINAVPAKFSGYRYVTFRIGSYTRRELKELKSRLVSDLERVRILRQRVCSPAMPKLNYRSQAMPKLNYRPPAMELPASPEALFTIKEPQKREIGQKRTNPLPPVRDTKKQCGRMTIAQRRKTMMKQCGQILGKLMQHKHGWVFNTPVDAAALKLYDYHNIITNPMDLGTIKSKLAKNEYSSSLAFASDVRLTFQNAMLYNGKGSAVFLMAERLLLLFEGLFDQPQRHKRVANRVKKQNRVVEPEHEPEPQVVVVQAPVAVRVSNKPLMTAEEKSELAESFLNLQLGTDGMNQVVAILKKGVLGLEHQGNEIDIDLAVLDNDTLWELHGFVLRARKERVDHFAGNEHVVEINQASGEEYIDIGEEMQSTVFSPVVIEKDTVNDSSSESSSDSDSSSSGDSGSGDSYNEEEVKSTPKVDQ